MHIQLRREQEAEAARINHELHQRAQRITQDQVCVRVCGLCAHVCVRACMRARLPDTGATERHPRHSIMIPDSVLHVTFPLLSGMIQVRRQLDDPERREDFPQTNDDTDRREPDDAPERRRSRSPRQGRGSSALRQRRGSWERERERERER